MYKRVKTIMGWFVLGSGFKGLNKTLFRYVFGRDIMLWDLFDGERTFLEYFDELLA